MVKTRSLYLTWAPIGTGTKTELPYVYVKTRSAQPQTCVADCLSVCLCLVTDLFTLMCSRCSDGVFVPNYACFRPHLNSTVS